MTVIERILQLKEERSLTKKEVETGAGLANSSLSQWEKGKGKPSLENIIKLCRFFDVSSDYLPGLSDERKQEVQDTDKITKFELSLSEEELLLVDAFRYSSASYRLRIIQYCMNALDSSQENHKKKQD